ncbi:MAG: hypothetical protein IPI46_07505 [Bacteroidetes bacterium]|nr:hypothetical protein [Bacteroidota bacterium]
MAPLYIISSSCISPQPSFGVEALLNEMISYEGNRLSCIEPDYKQFINPVQIRRMSRALKFGFSAAMDCLQKVNCQPEAIIIGTGTGCLTDTEVFLHSIKDYEETALNATPFIHSTYNQLNGMIALNKKVNSYSVTYVHRAFSFEHCLLDTALLFDENEIETSLVGCFDEMTKEHFDMKMQWGFWKQESIQSESLLLHNSLGSIAGEGSTFFMLSKTKPETECNSILDIATLFQPTVFDLEKEIQYLLAKNNLQLSDIDILLSGDNGDTNTFEANDFVKRFCASSTLLYFKHLCGEYDTATGFAVHLANQILTEQVIPDYLYHPEEINKRSQKPIRHLLIYNNYFGMNQTLVLMVNY